MIMGVSPIILINFRLNFMITGETPVIMITL